MANSWIKYTLIFVILILLQILVLNHISFFDHATPFLYIYLIIIMPMGINRNLLLLVAFLLGLIIDIFCNTPGQNAAASVFAAFMCRPMQLLFFDREDFEHIAPSISTLGGAFMKYTFLVVLLHHIVLISISSFSYFNIQTICLRIVLSTILTSVLIFAIEGITSKRKVRE